VPNRELEKRKSEELLALVMRLGRIESRGLSKLYMEHISKLPAWKQFFDQEAQTRGVPVSNQRLGFSLGLRLRRLASEGKIREIAEADPNRPSIQIHVAYQPRPNRRGGGGDGCGVV